MIYVLLFITLLIVLVRIFPSLAPSIGYGIAAKAATTLSIEGGGELERRVRKNLLVLGCKIVSEGPKKMIGRTGISGRSWGEDISVVLDNHEVTATSQCVFPLQLLDWGKNKSNVERFVTAWQKYNT